MCNFYHVYPGAETEGFSFFWFSFRSVTIFYMLRGLLRLGVLSGLRGGTVPGRGEGKVYEVARNVGEVSGEWLQQQRQKMHIFVERLKLGGRTRGGHEEKGEISSNCSCFFIFKYCFSFSRCEHRLNWYFIQIHTVTRADTHIHSHTHKLS